MTERSILNDPIAFRVFNEIGIIDQLATAALERALPDGLKVSQFSVLNHCVRLGDNQSPAALARAFQVTKGAMTNTLKRLESRNLIIIRPDPMDGRGKRVFLTDAGRRVREEAVQTVTPMVNDLLVNMTIDEFASALPFLTKLRMRLDHARDREPRAGIPD